MPRFNMATLVTPPLGVSYVAAAIKQAGHDVSLIDAVGGAIETFSKHERGVLHGMRIEEIVEAIPSDTKCIGLSIQFSYEWPIGRQLLRRIRQRFSNAFLIAGGEHVSAVPELCIESGGLDAAVLGEGEFTACDLLAAYSRWGKNGLNTIAGIVYRNSDGEIVRTGQGQRALDLGQIPRPAWDLIPLEEYLSRGFGFGVNRGRSMPVLASRGCPYQCTFCSNPQMWTTKWLARDPDDLLDEISELQKRYQAENFDFYDLTAIVKRDWVLKFCQRILDRKLSFTWQLPSGTRSEAIDEEVSQMLYKTGCRNISYAPESGSDETLAIIKKKISKLKMLASIRGAVKSGMNVKANFILGFPHERYRHVVQTFAFIMRAAVVGTHDISIWIFVPYPGCELFDELRVKGEIGDLNDEFFYRLAAYADVTETFSYSPHLRTSTLLTLRVVGMFLFYLVSWILRPWRPFRLLWNAVSGRVDSRSESAIRGMISRILSTKRSSEPSY